uniref:polysaccharide deacetylase family protein n=1 Tax=Pararhizobium sp. IMCC3301 TaxID=3067904 RepID=UPI00274076F1|nr:polysaccharide deacetylase family protein [Pararhizobium sp. IMCC3301]
MLRRGLIKFALATLSSSGLANAMEPWTGGRGAILMLHRVRPQKNTPFQPNAHLEVTPQYVDEALTDLRRRGMEFISIDEIPERLASARAGRFIVVTLDDASLDNLTYGLDVFDSNDCPFTVYVTSGFVDRTTLPWWVVLEEVIASRAIVDARPLGGNSAEVLGSLQQKRRAFTRLSSQFKMVPERQKQAKVQDFAAMHGLNVDALMNNNFMNWQQLETLAESPLATIGGHTLSHPILARLKASEARAEIVLGAERIEEKLGRFPEHFAYPYGGSDAVEKTMFDMVEQLGFATAVTTRGGILKGDGKEHLTALPRVSVNGHYQDIRALRALISGFPYICRRAGLGTIFRKSSGLERQGAASTRL